MPTYTHELADWPNFHWDEKALTDRLAAVRHRQGRLIGRMEGLGFRLREEAVLSTLTQDVLKSSEIEGEILDKDQVRSSIARRLGIDIGALTPSDRDVAATLGARGKMIELSAALRRWKLQTPRRCRSFSASINRRDARKLVLSKASSKM